MEIFKKIMIYAGSILIILNLIVISTFLAYFVSDKQPLWQTLLISATVFICIIIAFCYIISQILAYLAQDNKFNKEKEQEERDIRRYCINCQIAVIQRYADNVQGIKKELNDMREKMNELKASWEKIEENPNLTLAEIPKSEKLAETIQDFIDKDFPMLQAKFEENDCQLFKEKLKELEDELQK